MISKESIINILGFLCLIVGWINILTIKEYEYSLILFGIALGFFISNMIMVNSSEKRGKIK